MIVKNNYNECLTNLACSIRKHFGLDIKHTSLDYIDDLLEKNNPKNVIVILLDGMGSRIIDRILDKNDFFIKNKYKEITTVFPATTTAATTSIRTGLNPVEHGWLGWNMYVEPLNKTITLFTGEEKETGDIIEDYINDKTLLYNDNIVKEINRKGTYKAIELFPFGENKYNDLDEMIERIYEESKKDGKKYIYAYNDEPDHTMHEYGPDSEEAISLIKERNDKIEKLCSKLEDSIVIVIADHGHTKVDTIKLDEYKDIVDTMERTTSLEPRATSFKIKEGRKEEFKELFNKYFGKYFSLYEKEDIINSNLFGDGEPNIFFYSAIGDFIAIAEKENKALLMPGDHDLYSMHAGYTDDEIYIPLIIVNKKNS